MHNAEPPKLGTLPRQHFAAVSRCSAAVYLLRGRNDRIISIIDDYTGAHACKFTLLHSLLPESLAHLTLSSFSCDGQAITLEEGGHCRSPVD